MSNHLYAGAAPWAAASKNAPTGGLFRLDTRTGRWDEPTLGLPSPVEARCIAVQPGVIYVGTQSGPYRSTDGGKSWSRLALPGTGQVVWSILLHPTDPKVI